MGTGKAGNGRDGRANGAKTTSAATRAMLLTAVLAIYLMTGPWYLLVAYANPWGTIGSSVEGGMSGVKTATIAMATGGFATGIAVRTVPVLSRKLRENGLEWVENAAITTGVIGLGGAALTFANEIGASMGGERTSIPNPWR